MNADDHCVYVWSFAGQITIEKTVVGPGPVYVGHGKRARVRSHIGYGRFKDCTALKGEFFTAVRNDPRLTVTIIADGLSKDLAIETEMSLISCYGLLREGGRLLNHMGPNPATQTNAMLAEVRGELADMREELAATRSENPIAHWQTAPAETGRVMRRVNRRAAETLARAVLETDENNNDDDERGASAARSPRQHE